MVERKNPKQMAIYLTRELLDDNLMKTYGTSLNVNMGREYQKHLERKYLALKAEFDEINKNTDDIITMDELTDFINDKAVEVLIANYLDRTALSQGLYRKIV
jgi:hypothetical protein